jgi:hypothetical protein
VETTTKKLGPPESAFLLFVISNDWKFRASLFPTAGSFGTGGMRALKIALGPAGA